MRCITCHSTTRGKRPGALTSSLASGHFRPDFIPVFGRGFFCFGKYLPHTPEHMAKKNPASYNSCGVF